MPYTILLNQLIARSGLSIKEIAQRCNEQGQKITAAYISILRNAENERIPSDEISIALAKACNADYEDLLVIEGYIDKAPLSFRGAVDYIKQSAIATAVLTYSKQGMKVSSKQMEELIESIPAAEMIIGLSRNRNVDLSMIDGKTTVKFDGDNDIRLTTEFNNPVSWAVEDNSMYPLLPQGSKVLLGISEISGYKDGDILCFNYKEDRDKLFYRKVAFLNKEHTQMAMFPMNTEYETKTLTTEEINILGKVREVMIKFE